MYFSDVHVVAVGDELVHPQSPNIDYPNGGSVIGWMQSIDPVSKLDFDLAIPGHGVPMTNEEFIAYKAKVDTFAQRSIDVARRNVRRAQLYMSEIQQYDLAWNITMPDAHLMPLWNETRAQGTAHPPQLCGCPAARRRGMPPQTIW